MGTFTLLLAVKGSQYESIDLMTKDISSPFLPNRGEEIILPGGFGTEVASRYWEADGKVFVVLPHFAEGMDEETRERFSNIAVSSDGIRRIEFWNPEEMGTSLIPLLKKNGWTSYV